MRTPRPLLWGRGAGCSVRVGGAGASDGSTGPGVATLEGASLVLGKATPDAGVLSGLQRPLQAGVHDRAPAADGLGLLDLQQGRAGVADREEQLGILVEAGSAVAPVHRDRSPS